MIHSNLDFIKILKEQVKDLESKLKDSLSLEAVLQSEIKHLTVKLERLSLVNSLLTEENNQLKIRLAIKDREVITLAKDNYNHELYQRQLLALLTLSAVDGEPEIS